MNDYYGWRARIGLIYPAEGLVVEPEFHAMSPDGVSVHPTRIDLSKTTLSGLSEMMDDDRIEVASRLFGRAPLSVLTFLESLVLPTTGLTRGLCILEGQLRLAR